MSRSGYFLVFTTSFLAGIAFTSYINMGLAWAGLFVLLAGALFVWVKNEEASPSRAGRSESEASLFFIHTLVLIALGFAMGSARMDFAVVRESILAQKVREQVQLTGIISAEPDEREASTKYVFAPEGSEEKILITAPRFPAFRYGDKLKVAGRLDSPENFEGDGGKEFDYKGYLAKNNIYYLMYQPKVELVSSGNGSWLVEKLYVFRRNFIFNLAETMPEPESSLMAGISIGAKSGISPDLSKDFQTAGVSHIVVLSGYNITIIADNVARITAWLPRSGGIIFSIIGILLFAIMTGGGSTVVRASLMAMIVILARIGGRLYNAGIALLFAGFVMVLFNPKILVFDIGFQLSFLATLGIIYFPEILEKYFMWIPKRFTLRDTAVSTVSAQLFVYPWIVYKMGTLSLVSLPVNMLILPIVPATMYLGLITGTLGFVSHFVSLPFAYVSYFFVEYILKIAQFSASLPLAAVEIKIFPTLLVVFVYVFFAIMIFKNVRANKKIL